MIGPGTEVRLDPIAGTGPGHESGYGVMADRPVVVGTDGSPAATAALEWGAGDAVRRGLPLRVVNASVWGQYGAGAASLTDPVVEDALALVGSRWPALAASGEVLLGEPTSVLLAASEGAEMLVLGCRTLGKIAKALLGSVSLPVVARAECPVVVVRDAIPSPAAGHQQVVLGLGAGGSAAPVTRFAFEEASARACPLRAVHTWHVPPAEAPTAHTGQFDDARRSHAARAADHLDERLAAVVTDFPDVTVHRAPDEGRAAETLLDAAEGAALLVIGARRRGTHPGPRPGPVTHAMLHHAPCPVAVVPHR